MKRISESVSEKYETDSKIRFTNFNFFSRIGFRNPFHTFLKRIPKSVSYISETDSEIRFIIFFMKQISESASYFSETNSEIRFTNFNFFSRNRF